MLGDPFAHEFCGDRREQDAVAVVASGEGQTFQFAGTEQRKMVGRVRTKAAPGFDDFRIGERRDEFLGGGKNLLESARRYSFFEANILDGAACNDALRAGVIARNEVAALGTQHAAQTGPGIVQRTIWPRIGRVAAGERSPSI